MRCTSSHDFAAGVLLSPCKVTTAATIRKNLTEDCARKAAPETKHWDTRVKGFHLACGKSKTW